MRKEWFRVGRLPLALVAACLPLSIAASNAACGLALLAALAGWAARPGFRYRWTGLERAWGIYFVFSLLSSLFSAGPAHSLRKLSSEALILFFLLASQGQEPEDADRNVKIFLSSSALAGLWGIWQYMSGADWIPDTDVLARPAWAVSWPAALLKESATRNGRAMGFFSHPLTYAELLVLAWPLLLAGALGAEGRKRIPWGLGALLVLGGIICSESRGVWVALSVLLAVWIILKRRKAVLGVSVVMAFLASFSIWASPRLSDRAASLARMGGDPSGGIRLRLWKAAARELGTHPLTGFGPGHLRLKTGGGPLSERDWTEAHNIFLQVGLERGLPGLAAFLFLLWTMGKIFWRAQGPPWTEGLFFGYVGLLAAGFTESWTNDSEVMMSFYFLLGCAAVLRDRSGDPS